MVTIHTTPCHTQNLPAFPPAFSLCHKVQLSSSKSSQGSATLRLVYFGLPRTISHFYASVVAQSVANCIATPDKRTASLVRLVRFRVCQFSIHCGGADIGGEEGIRRKKPGLYCLVLFFLRRRLPSTTIFTIPYPEAQAALNRKCACRRASENTRILYT